MGNVVLEDEVPGPEDLSTGVPNFKELGYAAAQLAGSLQNFDGNGPYLRASAGNGPVTVEGRPAWRRPRTSCSSATRPTRRSAPAR